MFYNPDAFEVLPYRHKYTQTGEEVLTAYFLPAFSIVRGKYMDHRGYTDPVEGKKYYEEQRMKYASTPKDLITYSSEFCFVPEEAFSLEGDNKFNKIRIAELLTAIRALKLGPTVETGFIESKFKDNVHEKQNIEGVRWIPHKNGPIKIVEHPIWTLPDVKDENGKVIKAYPKEKIKGLYVIGIDGIDIGLSQTSEYTKDPSDFCLVVKKRAYGLDEPLYVCVYKDRPDNVREAYRIAVHLAHYYNAVINIEATRQGIIPWCRERKLLSYFMKRPRATLSDSIRNTNKQYGTPATAAIIAHQTDLIADYVQDYCHNIWFEEILDELNRYTDANKRKFDIVASLGMAELADEELSGVVPKLEEDKNEVWLDIGYYTDENGVKHWGAIPNLRLINIKINWDEYDDGRIRTSDPRILFGYL